MKVKKGKQDWRIASEIELIYKTKVKASERPQITSSKATYKLALQSWNPNKIEFLEQFKVLLLNKANRVLGIYEASTGGITATTVDLRLLFTAALKAKATALIMLHNHPSGKAFPSTADKVMTKKVKDAGVILDIEVVDHLIITPDGYYSFADNGIM